jgi:hypothetical protein
MSNPANRQGYAAAGRTKKSQFSLVSIPLPLQHQIRLQWNHTISSSFFEDSARCIGLFYELIYARSLTFMPRTLNPSGITMNPNLMVSPASARLQGVENIP